MIEFTKGNILESECQAIINTVNCKGVMGAGLALQYRQKYPEMYLAYRRKCLEGLRPGSLHVWKISQQNKWVVNFPTKDHWRNPSLMEYIKDGLLALMDFIKENNIKSVAIPPLGCGLGGLHWYLVKKEIVECCEKHLDDSVKILIYEPEDAK